MTHVLTHVLTHVIPLVYKQADDLKAEAAMREKIKKRQREEAEAARQHAEVGPRLK